MSLLWLILSCTCGEPAVSYGGLPTATAYADTRARLFELRALIDLESWDVFPRAQQLTEAEPQAMLPWLVLAAAAPSREEAMAALTRAAALAEQGTEAERLLLAVAQGQDTPEGLASAKVLTEKFPESPESWLVLSRVHTQRGETEPARRAAERALQLDSTSVSAHALLGESYTFSEPRDLAKAEQYYLETTELRPRLGATWINLGDVYRAGRDLQKAQAQYAQAIEQDPRNPIGPVKRGHVHVLLGNYEQARKDYEMGLSLASERDKLELGIFRVLVSAHEGDPRSALLEMEALLAQIRASRLSGLEQRAIRQPLLQDMLLTALHLGEMERAHALVGSLELQPVEMAYWRARVSLDPAQIGQYGALVREGTPRQQQRHEELLGLLAVKTGDLAAATEHLRKADLETGVMTRYQLARVLEMQGAVDEARALYRQIADWGFLSADYALLRAEAETRSRASP